MSQSNGEYQPFKGPILTDSNIVGSAFAERFLTPLSPKRFHKRRSFSLKRSGSSHRSKKNDIPGTQLVTPTSSVENEPEPKKKSFFGFLSRTSSSPKASPKASPKPQAMHQSRDAAKSNMPSNQPKFQEKTVAVRRRNSNGMATNLKPSKSNSEISLVTMEDRATSGMVLKVKSRNDSRIGKSKYSTLTSCLMVALLVVVVWQLFRMYTEADHPGWAFVEKLSDSSKKLVEKLSVSSKQLQEAIDDSVLKLKEILASFEKTVIETPKPKKAFGFGGRRN